VVEQPDNILTQLYGERNNITIFAVPISAKVVENSVLGRILDTGSRKSDSKSTYISGEFPEVACTKERKRNKKVTLKASI